MPSLLQATRLAASGSASVVALESQGACIVKSADFAWQSFFDNTGLGQALLTQPPGGDLIVPSTAADVAAAGLGAGLHPDSQAPIAIRFKTQSGAQDSQTYLLTPGEMVWPYDKPFSGFRWGLPFGWLGGGLVKLVVWKTRDARSLWPYQKVEVAVHRQRAQIQADGATPTFSYGLPLRFPWKNAQRWFSASTSVPQVGSPLVAIEPTRTLFKLRLTAFAGGDMRMLVKNSQVFDTTSASPPGLSGDVEGIQITFPAVAGAAPYNPSAEIQLPEVLLAGDDATFALTDATAGALANQYVDIVRFGRI